MATHRERGNANTFPKPPPRGDIDYDPVTAPFLDKMYKKNQKDVESLIAIEEMRQLQEKISICFIQNGVNHKIACKDLVEEYRSRLRAPHYLPPADSKFDTTVKREVFDE